MTIYDHPNIGNRLQNYALQETLKKLGLSVSTLNFTQNKINKATKLKCIIQKISGYVLPGDLNYWRFIFPRELKFERFNKLFINTVSIYDISKLFQYKSDFWIVGSDQVWNILWYNDFEKERYVYFLDFVESKKKISYSASFGVKNIPDKWSGWIGERLHNFRTISVREESGKEIVEKLTGKKAEIHIDPTLLLSSDEWDHVKQKPDHIDFSEPYLLTYFLGNKSCNTNRVISKIAEDYKLKIYNLLDYEQPELYTIDPAEFLFLVKNAAIVLTDSFHACVFSFIYGKPFLVFDREGLDMDISSRIDTFIHTFHLDRKRFSEDIPDNLMEHNYDEGMFVLEKERKKSLEYLQSSTLTLE